MTETLQVPSAHRAATVDTSSYDEASNTIDVIWTTGSDWPRRDILDNVYIERLATASENVRLARLNNGAGFLDSHNTSSTASYLGKVVPGSARMEDGKGICKLRLSRSKRAADTVADIKDGIISQVSVGYVIWSYLRSETDDGQVLMTAVDWEPTEISACAVAVDAGAGILNGRRSADGAELNSCTIIRATDTNNEEATVADKTNNEKPEEETRDVSPGDTTVDETTCDSEVATDVDATPVIPEEEEAEETVSITTDASAETRSFGISEAELARIRTEAIEGDRSRQSEIRSLSNRFPNMTGLADEHCRSGSSIDAFRVVLIDALAAQSQRSAPSVNITREASLERKPSGAKDWSHLASK